MALDWCMHCRRPLSASSQSDYCSSDCHRKSQATTSAVTLDTVDLDAAESGNTVAITEALPSRAPSPTQWPQAGIAAWRAGIPTTDETAHPYAFEGARPASPSGSLTSSTRTFSRPELLRRHTPHAPAPASVAVCRTRHAAAPASPPAPVPGRAGRPAWATPMTSSTASYIADSLVGTPASLPRSRGLLHRVKSWVRPEGAAPAAVAPTFVTLPGMDSTSTLVGDVAAAVEKKVAALVDEDAEEEERAWQPKTPTGFSRAVFRAPRSSRLALDEHPAYTSRGRSRGAPPTPERPPMFSPFGHVL